MNCVFICSLVWCNELCVGYKKCMEWTTLKYCQIFVWYHYFCSVKHNCYHWKNIRMDWCDEEGIHRLCWSNVPNCPHKIFFVFCCGRPEYLAPLQVCYSHQGVGIVKLYWDNYLLCKTKRSQWQIGLWPTSFASTGWSSNKLQVEFIWICLEKILSKQVELWVEGKEWRTFWCFGLWLHLVWLLTLSFHVLW